jgi:hypothetical protein
MYSLQKLFSQDVMQEKWLNKSNLYKAIIPPPKYDGLNGVLSRVE